jgi:hypothetical protein
MIRGLVTSFPDDLFNILNLPTGQAASKVAIQRDTNKN